MCVLQAVAVAAAVVVDGANPNLVLESRRKEKDRGKAAFGNISSVLNPICTMPTLHNTHTNSTSCVHKSIRNRREEEAAAAVVDSVVDVVELVGCRRRFLLSPSRQA